MEPAIIEQENVAPARGKAKKAPKAAAPKAAKAALPLQPTSASFLNSTSNTSAAGKTIEEVYQKKTQLEHILLRPDTYVGSTEKHTQELWVYEEGKVVQRPVSYVPGLYKIFDEILVNAADNKQRDPSMRNLKVTIDTDSNSISVYNDGDGVPVEVHAEEKVYVPELIFGHLLTSSNYDDSVKKTTGGRNGYGAKLTNIFSTEFVIETADGKRSRRYKQVFRDNMSHKGEPEIKACKSEENWTKVTFKPDLAKFKMDHLEADVVALMSKRVLDMAGCLGSTVKVDLNGKRLPIKSFTDYVKLYLSSSREEGEPLPVCIQERVNDRWEVCVSQSDGQFRQVSFVNSICTTKGGSHVNAVTEQIVTKLIDSINKKKEYKQAGIKPFQVRSHLWVFVNSLIENPAFDSQTKETLTTNSKSFGSAVSLSDEFCKKVIKSPILEAVLSVVSNKLAKDLKKNDGTKRQRLTGIAKLTDANDAGGRNSEHCTLILTEGDSAATLATAGLSVVGRDRYGVFPLRGKLLNVRDAAHKQIMDNAEISAIKQIMGLQQGKEYDSTKPLRYGHLMIMTDQDHDGSHIKGLLINFLHTFWPSLLKTPGFLLEFITPIVKAKRANGQQSLSFYTIPEYQSWRESLGGHTKEWEIKYYKGLGTSSAKEAKEYFSTLDRHRKDFEWVSETDGEMIEMAFSKKKVDARKTWLSNFEPGTFLDQELKSINYSDFVNRELILFSLADLARSIPNVMDGFKPGQRKIIFCALKKPLTREVKVAEFAGHVSEHSAYHHGEASLQSTIIGLAQDFVGSNNINLLSPNGQFGSRLQGGKDAASPRYVFTALAKIARKILPKADDCLLDYLQDDGKSIEPSWYAPVLPMVLVNGSEGIGTGWSSSVPNYNPRDIVDNLRRLIQGEPMQPMDPWYKGFTGSIERSGEKNGGQSYTVTGNIAQINETTLEITELPLRKWTQDYKEFLEGMMEPDSKGGAAFIKDYKEYHTDSRVHFVVQLSEENMAAALAQGLVKKFKLSTSISTSNMHLFDPKNRITKYETPEQIMEVFYGVRLEYYEKRKAAQRDQLQFDLDKLSEKVRFIRLVVSGELEVRNRRRAELLAELVKHKFMAVDRNNKRMAASSKVELEDESPENEGEEEEPEEEDAKKKKSKGASGYDYLLSMPIWNLTAEKAEALMHERDGKEVELQELLKVEVKSLWLKDLDDFMAAYEAKEAEEAKEEAKGAAQRKKGGGIPAKGRKKAAAESDDDDDMFEVVKKKPAARKAPAAPKPKPSAPPALKPATLLEPQPSSTASGAPALSISAAPTASLALEVGSEDEDDSLLSMSLKQRLAAMPKPAKPAAAPTGGRKAAAPKAKTVAAKAARSETSSESEAEHDLVETALQEKPKPVPKPAPAKAKAPAARKPRGPAKRVIASDTEDDVSTDESPLPKGKGQKPAKVSIAAKAPVKQEAAAETLPRRPARASRAAAPKSYIVDLSDSEEQASSDDSLFE